jgi:hypothetical protein
LSAGVKIHRPWRTLLNIRFLWFNSNIGRPGLWGRSSVIGLMNISFQEWKKFCAGENVHFRNLLILDYASAYVVDYVSLSENVKVIYMPLRTTPVMQLMGQSVVSALNSYYLHHISISS